MTGATKSKVKGGKTTRSTYIAPAASMAITESYQKAPGGTDSLSLRKLGTKYLDWWTISVLGVCLIESLQTQSSAIARVKFAARFEPL